MFVEQLSRQLNHNIDQATFVKGWNAIYMDIVPGIDELLESLKEKYRIVALTNTNLTHSKVWKGKYSSTLRYFEKVFSSCEMGTRKPEKHAYTTVLKFLGTTAEETIFLDDNQEYTESAKELGMEAVCVASFDQMVNDLKELLIDDLILQQK